MIADVAAVLHGHVRTTLDVNVLVYVPLASMGNSLKAAGYASDSKRREFLKELIPVHLVCESDVAVPRDEFTEIEEVQTLSLRDLVNRKLNSGIGSLWLLQTNKPPALKMAASCQ